MFLFCMNLMLIWGLISRTHISLVKVRPKKYCKRPVFIWRQNQKYEISPIHDNDLQEAVV